MALAAGIALWFALPWAPLRQAAALAAVALAVGLALAGLRPLAWFAALLLAGLGVTEARVALNQHPVLGDRQFALITARVESAEPLAFGEQRLLLVPPPSARMPGADLPEGVLRLRVRVRGNVQTGQPPVPAGAVVSLRALLSPPAGMAVPGGFDLARRSWFDGIGATGVALGPVQLLAPPPPGPQLWLAGVRGQLQTLITARMPGEVGAVAAAFVTGWQGAIPPATAQAMRDAGLAHLLSISGLHIAVVVGSVALFSRSLLGLWPWLALRAPVPTLALATGALAGLAYTLLAGAQVPTVRAVIAACIVVVGMMLGRQALSLRLLAAAAFAILVVRPEALLGASFQMSFAAVIGIVALYESRLGKWLTAVREDEPWWQWLARAAASLLASGLVAEFALSGIGLYHFGRSGLYGIAANLIAIPLTSFVVMPALMLALLAEALGLGWLWPLASWAMQWLIDLADTTASLPGAVITSAAIPGPVFALGAAGGLWLALWRTRARWWGLAPMAAAVVLAQAAPVPDLLISGDGRHLALRLPDGRLAHSRERVGDFLLDNWAEAVGSDPASAVWIGTLPSARCSAEACVADVERGGRHWRLLATTGRSLIPRGDFEPACAAADILVSDRRLPGWCRPRWLKLDAAALARTGAATVRLDGAGAVHTAADAAGDRPWQQRPAGRRTY
ncbi:ComEC/Rec2 family competence protein [Sandarakinorhabdus sp.]|uniref:ComEC/Rec2 family competence protein n=1 Tax=Sandarakinorhabdus sp. TaxID=1916663 RepID=UPI00286EABB6|nr:ComEC/Rec2 family competence protein [Sandarakinorhabdus sp.]